MEKIASFTVNHLDLEPGIYVSRKDKVGQETLTTFDLRMTAPNKEPVMNTAEIHTLEHLGATFLRNDPEYKDKTIYFGPMGCRTGFYFLVRDKISHSEALKIVVESFDFIKNFEGKIPGSNKEECGNYLDHDLNGAKAVAEDMSEVLKNWTEEKMNYAE